jgi:hypothetical protein
VARRGSMDVADGNEIERESGLCKLIKLVSEMKAG